LRVESVDRESSRRSVDSEPSTPGDYDYRVSAVDSGDYRLTSRAPVDIDCWSTVSTPPIGDGSSVPKQCPKCEQVYPDFVDFCVADGHRLERARPDTGESAPVFEESVTAEVGSAPYESASLPGRARLFAKVHGETQPFGVEFFGSVVLGRFDVEVGAVDVDLGDMPGSEFISARHAALKLEEGRWLVEDLGSEHGVFLDRDVKVTEPTPIHSGQELALGNALFVFETDEPDDGG
jgi:hypothetical protein